MSWGETKLGDMKIRTLIIQGFVGLAIALAGYFIFRKERAKPAPNKAIVALGFALIIAGMVYGWFMGAADSLLFGAFKNLIEN